MSDNHDHLLMREAADEIERLRKQLDRLNAYHVHIERMLEWCAGSNGCAATS